MLPFQDIVQGGQALAAEQFELAARLGKIFNGNSSGFIAGLIYLPSFESLPQRLLAAIQRPVRTVQAPIGRLYVHQHDVNLPLEIQTLFLQADARDQDAFDPAGGGKRRQDAAWVRGPQLVDFHPVTLKERLLKLKLKLRSISRVLKGESRLVDR